MLLIDTGDFSLPPGTRQLDLKERFFFEGMKLLEYDAVGIGECETRVGIEGRLAAGDRYDLPLVCSNLLDPALKKPFARTSIVKEIGGVRTLFGRRGGVRVGIFSVVLPSFIYQAGTDAHRRFFVLDPRLSALEEVTNLRARGCDLIIAIGHIGWRKSLDLARDVPGIDLILNGHRAHKRTHQERVGSTVVIDTGENEWSFTEVSVTFGGDSLVVAAADMCRAAIELGEDRRLVSLQRRYAEELDIPRSTQRINAGK